MKPLPLTLKAANDLVASWHRHHKPCRGHRFSIGAEKDGRLCGAAIVGRPVARACDQESIAEVTRLVTDGTRNACSFLYASVCRTARPWGFHFCQTYILASEPGTSLKAAGWRKVRTVKGRSWDTPTRRRVDSHPTEDKELWVCPCWKEAA